MATVQSLVTADEFARMSFDVPVELVRGEVLEIPPADQAHGCVEVLSENDRWREVHHKIDEFLERGVNEVWIVDPRKRQVQVFRPEEPPVRFDDGRDMTSEQLPGFACPVAEYFTGI